MEKVVRPLSAASVASDVAVQRLSFGTPEGAGPAYVILQPCPPHPGARSVTAALIPFGGPGVGCPGTPESMTAGAPRSQSPARKKYGAARSSPHVASVTHTSRICGAAGVPPGVCDQPWM